MTLNQRRLKAANASFARAKKSEASKIMAGDWIIENYIDKKGQTYQVWWKQCHWFFLGKCRGVFSLYFTRNSSKPHLDDAKLEGKRLLKVAS